MPRASSSATPSPTISAPATCRRPTGRGDVPRDSPPCPLGPWIETSIDPADLELRTEVDGAVKQRSRTSPLIHKIPERHPGGRPGDLRAERVGHDRGNRDPDEPRTNRLAT
ncbi:fumarylacetoacetate hydrolase family protein [Streptomyces sp. NPDC048277]|uniref:fumarylacetoacetate hydrolase family protein n=1 Tax=Streptomyces sp. NPDC048277 TaxID=3155027 RepID=UPI0033CE9215